MLRIPVVLSMLAVGAFTVSLTGCGNQGAKPGVKPAEQESPKKKQADHAHSGHSHVGDNQAPTEENSEIAKSLAKLSPADRAAAEKQKICPVSEGLLGAMGTPVKVTVKGHEVFLCCQGCEPAIKKDPDKYLAKLK
ncbi:MAG: hypothetical protein JXM70_26940 [Pirellulales bacterium]|nr:hypothetical protein [Pirellulales bacterium]